MSLVALWLSIVVATIPQEWQEKVLARLNPPLWPVSAQSARGFLFAGSVNATMRRKESLFSNTLVLPGFNLYEGLKIDDPKKLAWKEYFVDLRGRRLERAVLTGADLTGADLTGAQLSGADFAYAQLRGASFEQAELHGAPLEGAQLQGALLANARLQGADLFGASLQGASLKEAQLQGTFLGWAQLQGADLQWAQLQGANLSQAQLHGASLKDAEIKATNFSGLSLWRTGWANINPARIGAIELREPDWKAEVSVFEFETSYTAPYEAPTKRFGNRVRWSRESYSDLRNSLGERVPQGKMHEAALNRIKVLDCDNPDENLEPCDATAESPRPVRDWRKTLEQASIDGVAYEKALRAVFQDIACSSNDATYVMHSTTIPLRVFYTGEAQLVDRRP